MMHFKPLFRDVLQLLWRVWGRINDRNIENQMTKQGILSYRNNKCAKNNSSISIVSPINVIYIILIV